jgi:hypothetical protein
VLTDGWGLVLVLRTHLWASWKRSWAERSPSSCTEDLKYVRETSRSQQHIEAVNEGRTGERASHCSAWHVLPNRCPDFNADQKTRECELRGSSQTTDFNAYQQTG